MEKYEVRDRDTSPQGEQKIEWARRNMPLLRTLEEDFKENRYFQGLRLAVSIHLEAKTAYLARVLAAGGASVAVTGSNPLSTQDDVAAALIQDNISVFAWYGATEEEYRNHILQVLDTKPQIIIDDGGDIIHLLMQARQDLIPEVWGGCEETTTGVMRLRARAREGLLPFPMLAVNDAYCKYLFDNRYGTGQSVWDGIDGTTNLIVSGKTVVVIGYGWCGKGVSMRARGLGANVVICEVDPIKAVEAVMDGFRVMPLLEASAIGDIFITVTGCNKVIHREHFQKMKDGAILANAGHFDVEITIPDLQDLAVEEKELRKNIQGYRMEDGRWLHLLARGRLVNLAAGNGHPVEIMDLSFALQALSAKYLIANHERMEPGVYAVPEEIDHFVARLKLRTMGLDIDTLTPEQEQYLSGWEA